MHPQNWPGRIKMEKKWALVVYNDDLHTFEEVIDAFTSVLGIEQEGAIALASMISSPMGFAPVALFPEEEIAQKVAQELRYATAKGNAQQALAGIQVEVDDEIAKKIVESEDSSDDSQPFDTPDFL